MFICDRCKQVTKRYEPQHSVITQTREVTYPDGFKGKEIVKEIKVCSECVDDFPANAVTSVIVNK